MTAREVLLGRRNPLLRRRAGGGVGARPTVTFPTTPLNFRVQIGLSVNYSRPWWEWNWADITQYVRWTPTIAWSTGRPDEASSVDTGTGSLTLDNTDGRFSRRNPYGPYYGLLTKNTPIWIQADPGSGFVTLLQHYVNEWPSRWDQSRNDATVPIATAGILRRLRQGSVFKSPIRRAVAFTDPIAYWPLEDDSGATTGGSALSSGTPMQASGTVDFAAVTDLAGGVQTPDLSDGMLTGFISGASSTAWHAEFVVKRNFVAAAFAQLQTSSSTFATYRFFGPNSVGDSWLCIITDSAGVFVTTLATSTLSTTASESAWHHVAISATQSGGNVVTRLYLDGVLEATDTTAGTLAAPHTFLANHNFAVFASTTSMAHIAIGDGTTISDAAAAVDGYDGEQAHVRVARICEEEGIPFTATCWESQAMGPQPNAATALDIFRECEEADLGSLYETAFGLGFQGHVERDNAAVLLTLDMDQGHVSVPPEPADDDQNVRNRFTASRTGGSEATYEQTAGPMGTGTGGPGLYDDSATLNVQTDNQLLAAASARVVRGTVDEDRWPLVQSNFAATPSLIPTWTGMQPFGTRINIANPPDQMAPDIIDAFIDGYATAVTPIDWDVAVNTSPAVPHRVFVLAETTGDNNPNLGYMVPTTCVLAEDLDTTETGVDITTDPLWTTAADDWTPGALITIGGEDMTVTAVSGGSNPQTLTVTRSVNSVVKSHSAGAAVAFKYPGFLAL